MGWWGGGEERGERVLLEEDRQPRVLSVQRLDGKARRDKTSSVDAMAGALALCVETGT